ncbi:MAG TPA: ABC transporter permease [Acidimicrobiales bacterium]|nr:ABC transporter permease [Acidimicrobiales bacterium]
MGGHSRYAASRLALAVPTLFGLSFLSFLLGSASGDPSSKLASAGLPPEVFPTAEQIDAVRHRLGFDKPLLVQYGRWLRKALHGDLGRSLLTHRGVGDAIRAALPSTIELALAAVLVIVVVSLPLAMLGARLQGRWSQQALRAVELSGASVPWFFLAYLLIYVFAVKLHLVPVVGQSGLKSIVLPALTLAALPTALVARLLQSSLVEVLREDYVRTARSKGVADMRIYLGHALRNAALPVLTVLGSILANLIEGAIVVELIFGRSGIGNLTLQSAGSSDYPMIQGVVLLAGAMVILVNLAVDLLYPIVDVRVRLGART